jgi:arylsulfatase A-like enzyme
MKRREFIQAAGMVAGTAIVGSSASGMDAPAEQSPNILLIMTDQQSADAMSCRMGNRYIRTPAMDELAARGISFTRAYTPNPLCVPARTSIFTGQPPHVTGFQTNDLKRP